MRFQRAARVQTLGDYQLVRKLATGGMAEVYEARRTGPHGFAKRFAVKRILPQLAGDPRLLEMFCDEARIHAGLSHPNLVQVVDFGEHQGELFMAMEYVDGFSCAELMMRVTARRLTVELGAALHIGREVLHALAHAHAACDDSGRALKLVHRDVAPSNILIGKNGEVKLGDFGIVRAALIESRTAPGELKGKIGYISPEQAMGQPLDARSDLFSLAVVIAEMLVGRPLFDGQNEFEILTNLHAGNLERLEIHGRHVPDDVRAMLRRALSKRPHERFESAEALAQEIARLAARHNVEIGTHAFVQWMQDLGLIEVRSSTHELGEPRPPAITHPDTPASRDGDRPSDLPFADEITLSAEDAGLVVQPLDSVPPELEHAAVRPRRLRMHRSSGKHRIEEPEPDVLYRLRRLRGTIVGPLSLCHLLEMVATGRIGPDVELSRNDGPFLPAVSMGELARLTARPAYRFHDPLGMHASERILLDRRELPRVLFEIVRAKRTGLLAARHGREQRRLYFVDGALVFGASTDPDELLGSRLIRAGVLGQAEAMSALEIGWRRGRRLGETLIEHGWLRPSELLSAMTEQRRARLSGLCRWQAGELVFVDGALCGDEAVASSGAPLALIASVVLDAYTDAEISNLLAVVRNSPLELAPGGDRVRHALGLSPREDAALALAGHGHSLAQLLGWEGSYGLPEARAIERAVFIGLSAGVLWASGWRHA